MAEQQTNGEFEPVESGSGRRIPGPLQVAWTHKSLLVIGLICGLVLSGIFYSQYRPVYQCSAQVLIVQKKPDLAMAGNEVRGIYTNDYLSSHLVLIKSPKIVGNAIVAGKLQELESFKGSDPTSTIIDQLRVSREKETNNLLTVTFRSSVPEDCPIVVKAILKSYEDFLEDTYKDVSKQTVDYIEKASKLLDEEIKEQDEKYKKFRLKHTALLKGKEGQSVLLDEMITLQTDRRKLFQRKWELEARLEAFQKAVTDKRPDNELLLMVADATKKLAGDASTKPTSKDELIFVLKQKEQNLQEFWGEDAIEVRAVRKEIEMAQAYHKKFNPEDTVAVDPKEAHIRFLKYELLSVQTQDEGLQKRIKSELDEAQGLVVLEMEENELRNNIARKLLLFDGVLKRLGEINIVKEMGGYNSTTIAPPGVGVKVAPRGNIILSAGALLGLLCGLGLAYGAELTDHSFRTPDEIRQRLGLPVVGHIPFIAKNKMMADDSAEPSPIAIMLTSFHKPKSREAESYRGVRTALFFSAAKYGHKVVQVTSPDMGDGKSTLAANLAVSIAQAGKRVIILDADFRRPQVHKLFGASSDRGLASVMAEEVELADAIQATAVPGLWVLPCGPHPPNPAELLSQPRLRELLDHLREKYDFVIVDTPPLLAVTDPCMVVPHVDGVLLTIRIGKNARPHAQRAKEILMTLGANVLGVVVNEADRNVASGYGYYSGSRYGYGYGYRYNYTQYESYYADEQAPQPDASQGNGEADSGMPEVDPPKSPKKGLLQRLLDRM